MKFTFIANACGIFTGSNGTKILTDPWLDDGVFEGSWCHYPPLKTSHKDLQNVDAIYLSHIHPDHYDERFFDYPKNIPIFILENKYDFLGKNLKVKGYQKVIPLESGKPYHFKENIITIYSPFTSNVFHESNLGNLIDSAIVIEDIDGTSAFNANDNTPTIETCEILKSKYKSFDLAMINYNAAGPYPSCLRSFTKNEKIDAHHNVLKRNIEHLIKCCDILNPKIILPFAGSYVIGGKEYEKNSYLGTTTLDNCANEIRKFSKHNVLTLREGDTYDLSLCEVDKPYQPIDINLQNLYINTKLSKIKYPYELLPAVDQEQLNEKVKIALDALSRRIIKYKLNVKSKIKVFTDNNCWLINSGDSLFGVELNFFLDERLLNRILDRCSHWNNAEIGCHIEFERKPNIYEIDAHTMMQFFHC